MSGLKFTFEASGDKLVHRELVDISGRALDARPAFSAIADDLMHFEEQRFDSRGEGTWRPLQPQTLVEKARKHQDPRILHATLALRRSLTRRHDTNQQLVITDSFLLFGSKVPYAGYLQTGTQHMPARKPLGFREQQKRDVLKRLQRFVVEGHP